MSLESGPCDGVEHEIRAADGHLAVNLFHTITCCAGELVAYKKTEQSRSFASSVPFR